MGPASDSLTSMSDAFKFPKLNGSNYASWSGHMKSALQSKFLWLVVTGDEDCPPEADAKATDAEKRSAKKDRLEWMLRDQAAMGNIKGACENSQLPFIEKATIVTSQLMWEELKKVHQTNLSKINVHYMFEELYTRKYVDGSSMDEHIACLLDLSQRITSSGEKLEDLHLARAMILSLPKTPSWELVKIPLFELSTFTSELVGTRLLQEANRRTREKGGTDTALLVKDAKGKGKGKAKPPGKAKPDDECRRCGEKGHWARNCQKPENECKKKTDSAHLAVGDLKSLGTREIGKVYAMMDGSRKRADVLLDCAATSHMFHDRRAFTRYERSASDEAVTVGDGKQIPVAGRGTISIKCRLPNGVRTVVLHGVQHVPDITANLVSLGQLERLGVVGSFGGGCIKVSLDGDELFVAKLLSVNLYCIDTVAHQGTGAAYITENTGSLRLWHRRMGHLHLDAIRKLASKEMVKGLTISTQAFDRVCEGCVLGKSHRLPFPKISTTEYPMMGLLVVDLTGPMTVETWSGMSYALVVGEVSCRFGTGELLATKDEAYGALVDIVARLERQSGKKCQKIRSDGGGEFVNGLLDKFCKKNGIIHQTTLSYTPQQNGIAERAIVIYFNMVRCMLHSAKMDLRYWGEAFMYAVYI